MDAVGLSYGIQPGQLTIPNGGMGPLPTGGFVGNTTSPISAQDDGLTSGGAAAWHPLYGWKPWILLGIVGMIWLNAKE